MALAFPSYQSNHISDGFSQDQISGLMDLLGTQKEPEPVGSDAPSGAAPNMKVAVKKRSTKKDEQAIWQPQEFKAASGVVVKEQGDDRKEPKYDILRRQKLGAHDMYMNLQEVDPSSDHCNELLVKIWLPETELRDISLDVLEDRILLQAPKHRLNLPLPNKVKKDSGNAKWDKLKGLLSVVIPIDMKIKYFTNVEEALRD
eukprot:TRINITY_DN8183_c0_g1_i1.p1 TRINITY_DN8183_c0_g1~~TRINITY_DN8183_c0_g1_i1.p1  ORF type:complete len:201 (+),score=57.52 TRINITY_DN8183_c0_g1_i1:89-691(+)